MTDAVAAGGGNGERRRCSWASDQLLAAYHDAEWGVPVHDDRRHFEFLVLEGAQAGLSWLSVLRRRDAYREAFSDFEPAAVAKLGPADVDRLLGNSGIIRNRAKIESAVRNGRAFGEVQREHGSFDAYVWDFVGGAPIAVRREHESEIPAQTPLSKALSTDLRRRGFSFVGPVVCYAHMQATGLVMDHVTSCFRWKELAPR